VDFFTVLTIRFQILYVFLVLAHDLRRILHFAITAHPTAEWTAQQLREAFPWDSAPRYLLRDRIFGHDLVRQGKRWESSRCCQLRARPGKEEPRGIQPPESGRIISITEVGGIHHRYERRAA
jgi:hypothetical protein